MTFYQVLPSLDTLVPDTVSAQSQGNISKPVSYEGCHHMLLQSAVNIQNRFFLKNRLSTLSKGQWQIHISAPLTDAELLNSHRNRYTCNTPDDSVRHKPSTVRQNHDQFPDHYL